ncbi:ABC transporter permease [Solirubrobacter pauli]|uniref:ABC transporter permease n=1 Tax=Solirubrobacter pauli TaxID=166793 RepID=UPI001B884A10|nr:ABC transporter permease [Solirubrobacter pauli]
MSVAPLTPPADAVDVAVEPGAARRGAAARAVFFGRPSAAAASICLLVLIALAVFGPVIWNKDPAAVDVASALQAPSGAHPMGTDASGRDILTRFNHGARLSLTIAPLVVVVGAFFGGLVGLVAGVFRGWSDAVLMRIMDAVLAFPPLILAMAVTVGMGVGVTSAAVGIMLTSIPWYARLLRSDALSIRSRPYIEAARALGAGRARIVRRHVLPHVVPTLLVQGASVFGYSILTLAALGFVGLGAQSPTAEWGTMITEGLQYAITGQWWIVAFPGLGVFLAVTAANVLADRVQAVLDPRAGGRA